ncbi:MAG: zf-HC2 domain-containing protein [Nitrospirae bacterium]|nr:zf-HC2 domain-containing protein [Nitrospirota bacterium]
MKGLLARITLPCRDVTRLASESMDRSLPLSTRIQLQLHYWICQACTQYRRQLLVLRKATRLAASETHAQTDAQLSAAAKARLKEALRARRD